MDNLKMVAADAKVITEMHAIFALLSEAQQQRLAGIAEGMAIANAEIKKSA